MSNPQTETLDRQHDHGEQRRRWETMARAWLSTLPPGGTVGPEEIEAWIQSNHASLPDEIKSMPRSELHERLISLQDSGVSPREEKEAHLADPSKARFQRTDQWLPVYSWLESLDTDEPLKSKDILDWLSENPGVQEQLYLKHSRYHLVHYIKKCQIKILKRKEKKKGWKDTNKTSSPGIDTNEGKRHSVPSQCNNLSNIPIDSEVYTVKRNEAFHKYKILLDFEKQLSTLFPEHDTPRES